MESPPPRRIDRSQPARCARRRRWAGQFRHLASHPGQRIGSLFVNPGGPGDSGVAAVTGQGEALDAICPSDHLPFDSNFGQPTLFRGVR